MIIPIIIKMAIQGIWASFYRSKNIIKIQAHVNPSVSTLNVEKVNEIISKGLVSGD
jgi:hypothetical protein